MWWPDVRGQWRQLARVAAVLAAAGLTAGCWQPLYGRPATPGAENVQDKFAEIDIPEFKVLKGSPNERLAIGLRNALQFDLHNGGKGLPPAYKLVVNVSGSYFTAVIDPTSGRPSTNISAVTASYQLVELATGKTIVNDNAFAHVDFDIPGPEQRFAGQRAQRDAEDHALQVLAETIRNRLASYFVAGT
jgi:LPS-assembly lipoprotein